MGSEPRPQIGIFSASGGPAMQITHSRAYDVTPVWTPDGKTLYFSSNRDDGRFNLYARSASGLGQDEAVLRSDERKLVLAVSPDGKQLIYNSLNTRTRHTEAWLLPLKSQSHPSPFLQPDRDISEVEISSDGRWAAYVAMEDGWQHIYVTSFPLATQEWPVSDISGRNPRWRRDGKELFFLNEENAVVTVPVAYSSGHLQFGPAQTLFNSAARLGFYSVMDVSPDGERFVISETDESLSSPATMLVNWSPDLKK
jgi:Tol biopolymer transport system component